MTQNVEYAIVCIDDEPIILQMLGFQLEKIIGKECVAMEFFSSPEDAIEGINALCEENVQIIFVLVDYQMPRINGAELIRQVKSTNPSINFIMLSGQANSRQVDELLEDKMLTSFVTKPWREDDLRRAIGTLGDDSLMNIKTK
jgi:CheY-like chemotaxis protein